MRQKNNVLIILGMHRSGTSLAAQWLHACRLHLGDRLIGDSVGNENGHFEDLDFHDSHEEIFRANRLSYGGLQPISQLNVTASQKAKLKNLIDRKNALRTTWGVKDPRMCLFADVYELLIDCPTYLIMHRGGNETVNSLLKRRREMLLRGYDRWNIADRLNLFLMRKGIRVSSNSKREREYTQSWIHYNQKILDLVTILDKDRYKVIHYESILRDSKYVIAWLNERHFNLEDVPIEEVFDPSMFSSGVSANRIDEDLLGRVAAVERQFLELKEEHHPRLPLGNHSIDGLRD